MAQSTADRPSTFPWPPVLFASAVALALGLEWVLIRLPVPLAETPTVRFLGMTMVLAGILLVLWAAIEFRRHETSMRPDRGSDALVAAGPFAFSRNPMYLGEVIALVGAGLAANRLWLIAVAPIFVLAVTRLAIVREEAYLERRFGTDYLDYKARVRRWL